MVATKRKTNGDAIPTSKKAKLQVGSSARSGSAHVKPSRSEERGIEAEIPQHSSSGSDVPENEEHIKDTAADASRRNTNQGTPNKGVNGASANGTPSTTSDS